MPDFIFKLLGGVGERSEIEIDIPFEANVRQVKDLVRNAFKIAPMISIELMAGGKKLHDDTNWAMVPARPMKDTILVIGHRND
jgi:hypothetical protein